MLSDSYAVVTSCSRCTVAVKPSVSTSAVSSSRFFSKAAMRALRAIFEPPCCMPRKRCSLASSFSAASRFGPSGRYIFPRIMPKKEASNRRRSASFSFIKGVKREYVRPFDGDWHSIIISSSQRSIIPFGNCTSSGLTFCKRSY